MSISEAFRSWVDDRLDTVLPDQVHPFYMEEYTKQGPGYILFEFPSIEALRETKAKDTGEMKFVPLTSKRNEVLNLKPTFREKQGNDWLPIIGLVMEPDGSASISVQSLGVGYLTDALQKILHDGDTLTIIGRQGTKTTFCI